MLPSVEVHVSAKKRFGGNFVNKHMCGVEKATAKENGNNVIPGQGCK